MTLPLHLKGFEKVERAHTHELLYGKEKNRRNFLFWAAPRKTSHSGFSFFLVRQENEKAIIHAVLINHAFTSCLEVISQSEALAQTGAACVY